MAKILNGIETAKKIKKALSIRVLKIKENGIEPHMAIIRVGNDPASITYLKYKKIACESIGVKYSEIVLPSSISEQQLISEIEKINNNNLIHGLIVQFPIPNHISKTKIMSTISPKKDIDGLHPKNMIKMYQGIDGLKPCTPLGIITLLKHYKIELEGLNAVIIGRSKIVGEPLIKMLLDENVTVTVCFSKTKNLIEHTKTADLIISAVGHPHLIKNNMVKKGVILVDVGISRINGKIIGDIDFKNNEQSASWITPNPGGIGPMTIVSLLSNLVKAIDNLPNEE